jgi:hypothetical protein
MPCTGSSDRFAAVLVTLAVLALSSEANAAVWAWGCKGRLGDDAIAFNRNSLIVAPAKTVRVKMKELGNGADVETTEGLNFNADDNNSGFEKRMLFTEASDNGRKVTLTELSSRKVSERKGRIGPREEYTTLFKKIYRYALDGDKPQTVAMDCIEYMLTTRGGR